MDDGDINKVDVVKAALWTQDSIDAVINDMAIFSSADSENIKDLLSLVLCVDPI